jgi:hypothetical protein
MFPGHREGDMRPATELTVDGVSDLDRVWAGHPVGFALLTRRDRQFVAYYDAERRMTVAQRRLADGDGGDWEYHTLPERVGWDSHNDVTMAVDAADHLHLSGNMHGDPLVYFRTTEPLDVATFERVEALVGRDEDRVTYPRFVRGPDDALVFMYRDGGSGDGRRLLDAYDPEAGWRRLLEEPLLDGRGEMNAYPTGPRRGPDGDYHLCWVWRDTPDAATNHDLSYARSPDLRNWERSDGTPLDLPITVDTGEVVAPVPAGGGMINSNLAVGFDADDCPVLSYHRFDEDGNTQVYNARRGADGWTHVAASDWDYRWAFGGRGSIGAEIAVDPVRPTDDGLVQTFDHVEYGSGRWRLDPATLEPIGTDCPWHGLPGDLREPEGEAEGLRVQWAGDDGARPDGRQSLLRWESLGANRDAPREDAPDPTPLRVYTLS